MPAIPDEQATFLGAGQKSWSAPMAGQKSRSAPMAGQKSRQSVVFLPAPLEGRGAGGEALSGSIPSRSVGTREKNQPFFWRFFLKSLLQLPYNAKKAVYSLKSPAIFWYTTAVWTFSHRVHLSRVARAYPHFETPTQSDAPRLEFSALSAIRKVTGRFAKQVW